MSQELNDRRQRAREAWHDEFEQPGTVVERHARAVEAAIETATRVRITPEIVAAVHQPGTLTDEDALRAAFEAAGFEVES